MSIGYGYKQARIAGLDDHHTSHYRSNWLGISYFDCRVSRFDNVAKSYDCLKLHLIPCNTVCLINRVLFLVCD